MLGSPLIRSILIAVVLAFTALGIRGLTKPKPVDLPSSSSPPAAEAEQIETPFFLTLSAPAAEVVIEAGEETRRFTSLEQLLSGTIPLETGHPTIFLTIRWQDTTDQPRFAKLKLEPSGLPTQEKTFDARGELSDVWEPHLH